MAALEAAGQSSTAPESRSARRTSVALVCVRSELGEIAEAAARHLRTEHPVSLVAVLDAADTNSLGKAADCDTAVVLLGARTGGTGVMASVAGAGAPVVILRFPDHDAVSDEENAAARPLRKRAVGSFSSAADAVTLVRAIVRERVHETAPTPPAARATLEDWERAYLAERLPAWMIGRTAPSTERSDAWLPRSSAYVSLRAEPQPWCYSHEGRPVVSFAEEPGRTAFVEPGSCSGPAQGVLLELAVSHPDLPFLVVQGDGGFGKSVLLEHVASVLAATHLDRPDRAVPDHHLDLGALAAGAPLLRIPVLVNARDVAEAVAGVGAGAAIPESVRRAFEGVRDGQRDAVWTDLLARLDAGRYLLLVDALDEVSGASAREVARCFAGFADSRPRCRGVLTTRPDARVRLPARLRVLPIAPLGAEEVGLLVGRWSDARGYSKTEREAVSQAIAGLGEQHGAASLLEKPLLVSCLLLVYHHMEKKLPYRAASLYGVMLRILCSKPSPDGVMSGDEQLEALQRVMRYLQEQGGTGAPLWKVADHLLDQWRKGLGSRDQAETLISSELVARTAVLNLVEETPGQWVVRPWHRSFQEYLTALDFATGSEPVAGRLLETGAIFDPAWQGVLRFLVGTLFGRGSRLAVAYLNDLLAQGTAAGKREGHLLALVAEGLADYPELAQYDTRLRVVRDRVAERFAVVGASWPWRDRVLALEALGRLGDPRLSEANHWVDVPAGELTIGGDDQAYHSLPEQRVRVAAFRIARWPVTVAEYLEFVKSGRCFETPRRWGKQLQHLTRPVVGVSWLDAVDYCRWATGAQSEWSIMLPTEAEWEYAARGCEQPVKATAGPLESLLALRSRTTEWACGGKPGIGDAARGNYSWDADESPGTPTPVGAFPRGYRQGVWDLAGNVWEWCRSHFESGDEAADSSDGVGNRHHRFARGGSWISGASSLRSAARDFRHPKYGSVLVGFRVVCRRRAEN